MNVKKYKAVVLVLVLIVVVVSIVFVVGKQHDENVIVVDRNVVVEHMSICQSCGMPMREPEMFGTNLDGSKNDEYCVHCWVNGEFADWCKDMTVEEMIVYNVRFVLGSGVVETEDEALAILKDSIPLLRRWVVE